MSRIILKQQGYAMLELLMALVIWAVGILGITGLLLLSLRANNSSYMKQLSIQSAYDIIDRMRANRQAVLNGDYAVNNLTLGGTPALPSTPTDCSTNTCTATQLATYDTWFWLAKDLTELPNGSGSISTAMLGSNTEVTITLRWDDSLAKQKIGAMGAAPSGNANLIEYSIKTLL